MEEVFLGIGTNLGDRGGNLIKALGMIGEDIGIVSSLSSAYETEPWGFESDEKFLNIIARVVTSLTPQGLLESTLRIESVMGRSREGKRYSSRVIDIDILFYGYHLIDEVNLKIPHPRLAERRFVLVPLCEIAPDLIHPFFKISVSSLLDSCTDTCEVIYKGRLSL